ncbi:lysozyme inhibitor LprI family protein [Pectobacterium actinidiae]|uniref:lysozyme inhibitor LprI family protein n=1 Tax=Pectobacterium actinidiae TaxID=1507808 RepID=UPI002A83BE16|nr:lysozyme inhibitor LprI family protein [Pectobacterium actinidiae]MDY4314221.1 lysozyme inhibitor LprI family protein [Pectobacterium actinidiae]
MELKMIKIIIKTLLLTILLSHYVNANNLVCRSPLVIQSLIKEDQEKAQPIRERVSLETIKKIEFEYDIIITKLKTENNLSCFGKAKIKIPSDVVDFLKYYPIMDNGDSKAKNIYLLNIPPHKKGDEYIALDRVYYNVHIADNQQEANIMYPHDESVSHTLYGLAWLQENAARLEDQSPRFKYNKAIVEFREADSALNTYWSNLPDYIKGQLKEDARQWIKTKNKQCGAIETIASQNRSLEDQATIYTCQQQMTKERLAQLGLTENNDKK